MQDYIYTPTPVLCHWIPIFRQIQCCQVFFIIKHEEDDNGLKMFWPSKGRKLSLAGLTEKKMIKLPPLTNDTLKKNYIFNCTKGVRANYTVFLRTLLRKKDENYFVSIFAKNLYSRWEKGQTICWRFGNLQKKFGYRVFAGNFVT